MTDGTESFERLLAGIRHFRKETYVANRETYELAARTPQKPHTLFITCADSRIDPELLTNSGPGQIFVARNVGNLVPPYGPFIGGVSAIIEYAVVALKVEQVVICGHQDCGAMKGLLHPEQTKSLHSVREWLSHAEAALSVVNATEDAITSGDKGVTAKLDSLIEQNVLLQMNHLRTHPSVAGQFALRRLDIYGWVYDISSGGIRMYDEQERKFKLVNPV